MGRKKKGSAPVDKGFASFEDDFFTEGDEGNFLTDEESLEALDASVEDAPMEDFVPGDDDVPGDDEVPGSDDSEMDEGWGETPADIAAAAEEAIDEDMVATEAGGADAAKKVTEEPQIAEVGNEDLESVEMTSGEVEQAKAESAAESLDDETEVEVQNEEAEKAALAEARPEICRVRGTRRRVSRRLPWWAHPPSVRQKTVRRAGVQPSSCWSWRVRKACESAA